MGGARYEGVGMGPQYRSPKPDTKGDSVWILIDEDHDGSADRRIEFAKGLNCIQGLAWRGDELWIANAPDLTIFMVRLSSFSVFRPTEWKRIVSFLLPVGRM